MVLFEIPTVAPLPRNDILNLVIASFPTASHIVKLKFGRRNYVTEPSERVTISAALCTHWLRALRGKL